MTDALEDSPEAAAREATAKMAAAAREAAATEAEGAAAAPRWKEEAPAEAAPAEASASSAPVWAASSAADDSPVRDVVLFQNERFNAVTRRWSSASLLPTDRFAFSTSSGKQSWRERDRAAAEAWALGRDWAWVEGDGWTAGEWRYARDFTKTAFDGEPPREAGTFDFARRRRLSATSRDRPST